MNHSSQSTHPPLPGPGPGTTSGHGGWVEAPAPKSGSWVVVGLVAVAASAALTILGFIVLGIGAAIVYPSSDWDGEGGALAVIVLFIFSAATFGPASFFAGLMVGSRRYPSLGRSGLPFVGAVCSVPVLLGSLVALQEYVRPRGLGWAAWVAVAFLVVAVIGWLVASIDKISLRGASAISVGALVVVAALLMAATWNGGNFRRSERLAALQSDELTLYLPSSSTGGWQLERLHLFDPVQREVQGRIIVEVVSVRGTQARVLTSRSPADPICGWLATNGRTCRPLLTTPAGRTIEHENFGGFFYEITFDGEYVAIGSDQEISDEELVSLADALQRHTPESWLDRYEAFDNKN